ncbi:MAG: integration host factor subunit beta [Fibrobacteres bacterium]|nr:integration host factor subunit beta [Fibrobacterota bacterium]
MANVTKQDLITEISKNTGLTQSDVKVAVEEFLTVIGETLIKDSSIEIRGFGTFLTKVRKPRPARNPKTGEVVPLLERTVPLFKFSSELKHRIDKGGSAATGSSAKVAPAPSAPEPEIY